MTTATTAAPGTLASIDPATGEVVGSVPVTPSDAIAAVVERARAAQPAWAALDLAGRAERLRPAGARLVERADELGLLLTREMGKPLREGVGEVKYCGGSLAEEIDEIAAALSPEERADDNVSSVVHHDPFGVCAAITPWNFPVAMPHSLVIPALMAGNTVVLKPSEETPLIAQAYADVLNEYLPGDVLQVVHGADDQGKALVAADVDLIAFTGSREVGKMILAAASGGLKRVILELGGKDPMIVLHDADVEAAATFAVRNAFRNAGQVCVSTERIYVDEKIADDFERAMIRLTGEQKLGTGTDEGVTIGPMINDRQRDHVLRQIDDAVSRGATVAAGGSGHHDNYITPTVLTNVNHDMPIMRDETFGPVACVMRYDDETEAVRLANDTPFGLGAAVFGATDHACSVGRRLSAGMIGINKGCGGAKGSPWV
ncbi:MAG: aldehyde dehydrogenase family protein, partial [Planctomycetes bacterium]|nr:aldehyde dehydrogenase family protein [Planctomycetota bacterium]